MAALILNYAIIIILITTAIFGSALSTNKDVLNIAVYYESRCYDSKVFIINQLSKAVEAFSSEKLNVDLIPFGKGSVIDFSLFFTYNVKFKCFSFNF